MISNQNRYTEARGGLKPALTMLAEGAEFMPAWAIALLSLHSRDKEITNETVLSETELWVRFCELQQVDFSGIPFDHEEPVQTIAIVPPEYVIKRHVPAGEVLINTKSALAQMQLHYGVESVKKLTEPNNVTVDQIANDIKESRRNQQIDLICETAKQLGYDLLNIPEGGKAAIKIKCLENVGLFTDSGFGHAWKEANKRKAISMQNKEKYL